MYDIHTGMRHDWHYICIDKAPSEATFRGSEFLSYDLGNTSWKFIYFVGNVVFCISSFLFIFCLFVYGVYKIIYETFSPRPNRRWTNCKRTRCHLIILSNQTTKRPIILYKWVKKNDTLPVSFGRNGQEKKKKTWLCFRLENE